jgi:hypothetical protein
MIEGLIEGRGLKGLTGLEIRTCYFRERMYENE